MRVMTEEDHGSAGQPGEDNRSDEQSVFDSRLAGSSPFVFIDTSPVPRPLQAIEIRLAELRGLPEEFIDPGHQQGPAVKRGLGRRSSIISSDVQSPLLWYGYSPAPVRESAPISHAFESRRHDRAVAVTLPRPRRLGLVR